MVTINSAESNRAEVRYVKEASWGATPASGVTKSMRITKSGLVVSKDTKMSEEIRSDRMVPSIIELAASTSGPIEYHASSFSQDDFYEQFLLGTWSKDMNGLLVKGASVTVTGVSTITLTGADWTNWLTVNQYIKTEGFTNPVNNGYFKVSAKAFTAGNTVITVAETTLSAQAGSAYTKLFDASDVIVKANDVFIAASNVINSGVATPFSGSAVTIGQKLWFEGLGKETGTIVSAATDPGEGDLITISDGVNSLVFEVRTDPALVGNGNIHVPLSGTPNTMATSIKDAVNAQFAKQTFRITATVATDTVTLTNHRLTGGSIVESSAGFTTTAFTGGSASKGGFVTVSSINSTQTITVAETLTADANAGSKFCVLKGSHLRNPGTVSAITKRSISAETGFTDVAKYFSHRGLRTGSFKLEVKAGSIVNGSITLKGRDTTTGVATVLGNTGAYTVLAATSTEVWNATANVGTISKDGVDLTSAIMEITIEGDANLREQKAVGSKFPAGIGYGRFSMKGKISAYFDSFTNYNTFINHETTSLSFPFEDVDHNYTRFTLPALKMVSDPIAPGGIDQDVMEEIEINAQRDPVLNTMMMIDRFSSIFPFTGA